MHICTDASEGEDQEWWYIFRRLRRVWGVNRLTLRYECSCVLGFGRRGLLPEHLDLLLELPAEQLVV